MSITDAMSLASDVIKSRQGATTPTTTKSKTMKKEVLKQTDNKPQPTAEQLRIAQLINTKKEDPKLKEKLTQVMDATQKSMEEAYIALHDSEFDPNKAVNLLLEGDMGTQWSTLSKKKKTRTPGEKPANNKAENVQEVAHENEPWDTSVCAKPSIGNRGPNSRGRGRGARGRGSSFQQPEFVDRGRRYSRYNNGNNGDEKEENESTIIPSRTFERAVTPTVRRVYTWDPKHPISSMLNQNRSDDWDEEEYTGSLSSSLVYTSSGGSPVPKSSNSSNTIVPAVEPKKLITYENSSITPTSSYQPSIREQVTEIAASPPPQIAPNSTPSPLKIRFPPLGASVAKPPPKVDKPKENQEPSVNKVSSKPPMTTKIPIKPVEMPPNSVHNAIGILDIQFGSLDLKEENKDIPIFPTKPNITTPSGKSTENRPSNLSGTIDSPKNIFPSCSDVVVSSSQPSLAKESVRQVTNNPKKPHQPTSTYSPSYLSSLVTNSNITSNNSINQNTYTSSAGGVSSVATTACPPFHYSNYVTQPSQSVPLLPTLSNSYQNILGTQSFTTNSQSIYGSNVLPTSSYTIPYQTYSSTAQHKPTVLPLPFTASKDFELGSQNVSLNIASRSGVPTATSMLSTNQSYSSTKSSNIPKNPVLSNMPPLIGHQHPLFIGQGGIPYFQPPIYYQDLQLMQQQRLASPISTAYYDVGYTSLARDGVPYNVNERILTKQDSTPLQHGNQMIGGCVSGHLSTNNGVFGTETENYANCEGICENTDNPESSPSSQLIQSGMGLMTTSSNDPIDMCSKSINSAPRKNEYD